jgi:hypothetical protein
VCFLLSRRKAFLFPTWGFEILSPLKNRNIQLIPLYICTYIHIMPYFWLCFIVFIVPTLFSLWLSSPAGRICSNLFGIDTVLIQYKYIIHKYIRLYFIPSFLLYAMQTVSYISTTALLLPVCSSVVAWAWECESDWDGRTEQYSVQGEFPFWAPRWKCGEGMKEGGWHRFFSLPLPLAWLSLFPSFICIRKEQECKHTYGLDFALSEASGSGYSAYLSIIMIWYLGNIKYQVHTLFS